MKNEQPTAVVPDRLIKIFKSRENWNQYVEDLVKFSMDYAATITVHDIVLEFSDERFETGVVDLDGTPTEYRAFTVTLPDVGNRYGIFGIHENADKIRDFVENYCPDSLYLQRVAFSEEEVKRQLSFANRDASGTTCTWRFFNGITVRYYPRAEYPRYVALFLHHNSK